MKYMGSKASMLSNGLGSLIISQAAKAERVVDLFSGSGAVAWYAAERVDRPVLAIDLQHYAEVFARAVLNRTRPIDSASLEQDWTSRVARARRRSTWWGRCPEMNGAALSAEDVRAARELCATHGQGLVWSSYGGYYFSPRQALTLDLLHRDLPTAEPQRTMCRAALLMAASKCAAAPGHTAQPFSPSETALPFIGALWGIDPVDAAQSALRQLCPRHALRRGRARTGDAVASARRLRESDLVIVDPPYSAVQYSRFYHVLEAITRAEEFVPNGSGRYPPLSQRPQSEFSLVTAAPAALEALYANLEYSGCRVLVTFPAGRSSNGLTGDTVTALARKRFRVRRRRVRGRFSTLGGNNRHRPARHHSDELILLLEPLSA